MAIYLLIGLLACAVTSALAAAGALLAYWIGPDVAPACDCPECRHVPRAVARPRWPNALRGYWK